MLSVGQSCCLLTHNECSRRGMNIQEGRLVKLALNVVVLGSFHTHTHTHTHTHVRMGNTISSLCSCLATLMHVRDAFVSVVYVTHIKNKFQYKLCLSPLYVCG